MKLRKMQDCAPRYWVHQRGDDDTVGRERDEAWRDAVRRARTWDEMHDALPPTHPLAPLAANDGRRI